MHRARGHGIVAELETLRLADVAASIARLLSPTTLFVMEHDPVLEPSFNGKFEYCKVIDLGAVTNLAQTRKRLIISNVNLKIKSEPNGART